MKMQAQPLSTENFRFCFIEAKTVPLGVNKNDPLNGENMDLAGHIA
jgi:hypothetical protein